MPLESDTKPSITLVKTFTYRGNDEEWSNSYHFDIDDPASDAEWLALAAALMSEEAKCYSDAVTVVRAYGYESGHKVADFVKDWQADGGGTTGTLAGVDLNDRAPGDAACWLRWPTTARTAQGKRIYLRKYFHDVYHEPAAPDTVWSDQRDALEAFGAKLRDTSFHAGTVICGGQGLLTTAAQSGPYVTTRTLKRRGKRNPS